MGRSRRIAPMVTRWENRAESRWGLSPCRPGHFGLDLEAGRSGGKRMVLLTRRTTVVAEEETMRSRTSQKFETQWFVRPRWGHLGRFPLLRDSPSPRPQRGLRITAQGATLGIPTPPPRVLKERRIIPYRPPAPGPPPCSTLSERVHAIISARGCTPGWYPPPRWGNCARNKAMHPWVVVQGDVSGVMSAVLGALFHSDGMVLGSRAKGSRLSKTSKSRGSIHGRSHELPPVGEAFWKLVRFQPMQESHPPASPGQTRRVAW